MTKWPAMEVYQSLTALGKGPKLSCQRLRWTNPCKAVQSTGDLVFLTVFGAGLTWGAAVIEW